MTLANRITIGRLVLIPVFLVLLVSCTAESPEYRYGALATFIVASLSDALDGFVARAYNQKSKLGAVLDPLADKLLVNLAFVFMSVNPVTAEAIPKWFPVIVLSRDAIIVIGGYLINEYFGPLRVRPRIGGKLNTVFQMALVISALLGLWFSYHLMLATTLISIVSFFDYLYMGVKQIGNEDIG